MTELTHNSLSQLAKLIRAGEVSPVEVMEAHLNRIERLNPSLNAIVTLAPDAMRLAHDAEAAIMRGDEIGALHGVPVTVKDTIETEGIRTTSGSRLYANFIPSVDAPAVARLRSAGAIILGKTNVAEMAATYDTENPVFGRANNPYDLQRTPGGSSGGEAAAIASCLSPGGLGSDLMGSIRVPSHFCGIVGMKPTSGRVPGEGHIPLAVGPTSLGAAIGPMARHVEDVALLFRVIAHEEETRSKSAARSEFQFETSLHDCRASWHVYDGVTPVTAEVRSSVESAAHALSNAGLNVREEKPPGVERGQELWSALFARAALVQMQETYAGQEEQAGGFVRYLLESSRNSPSPPLDAYTRALKERDQLRATLVEWMEDSLLIIAPVGAMPAYEHNARNVEIEGNALSIFRAFSYSQTYNVLGFPAISVPAGRTSDGLPLGVQIIGRPFAEDSVLAAAALVEKALGGWQLPSKALTEKCNPL